MWIDTHTHLNDAAFADRLDEVLARATTGGIERMLVVGIDADSSERAVELAARFEPLYAVVGIQPNCLDSFQPDDWRRVRDLAVAAKVAAIGETGLDRHWNPATINVQRLHFERHLELAASLKLPVVIHCREAEADVVGVLETFFAKTGQGIAGVMHSFTGDSATARRCLDLGLYISFAGMVTFKKSQALREVAAVVPLERLLVETDSPYLAPEPVRGRTNEPGNVVHTGACLAAVKGIAVDSFAEATTANARRLFRLDCTD